MTVKVGLGPSNSDSVVARHHLVRSPLIEAWGDSGHTGAIVSPQFSGDSWPCFRRRYAPNLNCDREFSMRSILCAVPLQSQRFVINFAAFAETPIGADKQTAIAVTIYNGDLALVRDSRNVTLAIGENDLAFIEVSVGIRPETALADRSPAPSSTSWSRISISTC